MFIISCLARSAKSILNSTCYTYQCVLGETKHPSPHHVLQLEQKGEDLVVFIHAALCYDNIQRPVNLKEITEC